MNLLHRECDVFCRYLVGHQPTDYVRSKYREYHRLPAADRLLRSGAFDRFLLGFARIHPISALLADAYAGIFQRRGALRKKLVLLLAILESCAPSHQWVDDAPLVWGPRSWVGLAMSVVLGGLALLAALVLFLPGQLLLTAIGAICRRGVATEAA